MSTEYLDEGDLQSGDLAMQEDTSQVELDLETDVDVGTIDCGRPPQRETSVWYLV